MSVNTAAEVVRETLPTDGLSQDDYHSIMTNPKFQELVSSRNSFSWTLSIIMLIVYFGFILLVAYNKPLLAEKIGGSTVSLGIVLGLGVIITAFVLALIYVVRANGQYDDLTRELKEELDR